MEFTNTENPFELHRSELMLDDIIEYFVEPPFLNEIIGKRPTMIVGARGTGKTTLFEYLSYNNQKKLYGNELLRKNNFIGIYWKVDINYVSGFQKSKLDDDEWIKVFGHYINIALCLELCRILSDIQKDFNCLKNEKEICQQISTEVFNIDICLEYNDLYNELRRMRNEIEMYVNNIGRIERPLLVMPGKGHQIFCELLKNKEDVFNNTWFYFMIDEYENLLEYQQKIINTFIKHSKTPYSFKVCLRYNGLKTYQTLNSTETLSDPADYIKIDLYIKMEDKRIFGEFARKVCTKRLMKKINFEDAKSNTIDYLFPALEPDDEAMMIEKRKGMIYKDKFQKIIDKDINLTKKEKEDMLNEFLNEQNPIIRRLCLTILERGKITVKKLLIEYRKYKEGKDSDFTNGAEWIHNNQTGILFLMCSEYKIQKKYCGFNTFIHLSLGIIRYILELCYITWNFAEQETGFSIQNYKPISFDIQNKAARFVADKRLSEIKTYAPHGDFLSVFTLSLGRIFENYHKDPKQSEPERNQFTTSIESLDPKVKDILNTAIMRSIIQQIKGSKIKSNMSIRKDDYMLHPIYSPRFQISPFKGRKIELSPDQLEKIIFKTEFERKKIINELCKTNEILNTENELPFEEFME